MRRVMDILMVLMVVGIAFGALFYRNRDQAQATTADLQAERLAGMQIELQYYEALGKVGEVELSEAGYPLFVLPEWFGGEAASENLLAENDRPWLDVAPPGDMRMDPPDPILRNNLQAGLWYNPNTGVFRARVPDTLTEAQALATYNQVNGTQLTELRNRDLPDATPLAYVPDRVRAFTQGGQDFTLADVAFIDRETYHAEVQTERSEQAEIEPYEASTDSSTSSANETTTSSAAELPQTPRRPSLRGE